MHAHLAPPVVFPDAFLLVFSQMTNKSDRFMGPKHRGGGCSQQASNSNEPDVGAFQNFYDQQSITELPLQKKKLTLNFSLFPPFTLHFSLSLSDHASLLPNPTREQLTPAPVDVIKPEYITTTPAKYENSRIPRQFSLC